MSSVVISGDTSGAIILAAPAVAGSNTATLPAATGTVMVSGNMPAFFAYLTADQSITSSTYTKIAYDAEVFDTNNNFASSRFTPTVAGYYQISAGFDNTNSTAGVVRAILTVYKNGSQFIHLADFATGSAYTITGSALVYCNGTTDYIEIYGFLNATGPNFTGLVASSIYYTWMSGTLVRSA
jgi:hypothetical protein